MRKLIVLLIATSLLSSCNIDALEQKVNTLNISSVISSVQELTTLKYEYVDFGTYKDAETISIPFIGEKEIPLTKDEIIFTYGGTICVGFKLEEVTPTVDETTKVITITIPEPIVLSHTPNHDVEQTYVLKNSVLTSTTEQIGNYEDAKDELRKQKEEALMADDSTKEEAIKEYQEMCQSWLVGADPNVSDYTIEFIMEED